MEKLTKFINNHKDIIYYLATPLLIALYPILFLYRHNIEEVPAKLIYPPILFVFFGTLILGGIFYWLLKNKYKASIALSLFWLMFFGYGLLFKLVERWLPNFLTHDYVLLPLWLTLFGWLIYRLHHTKTLEPKYGQSLLALGSFLVALQIIGITSYHLGTPEVDRSSAHPNKYEYLQNPTDEKLAPRDNLPSIYYIMLDSYPRSDTLRDYFDFNNEEFDNFLESKGFYIAKNSFSNYNQTFFSMPATLNMSYLKDISQGGGSKKDKQVQLMLYSKVVDYLKSGGYRFLNNTTLTSTNNNPMADINYECKHTNDFVNEFMDLTILKPINFLDDDKRSDLRSETLCVLDNISNSVGLKGPKFVFSHVYPPHPPYLFGANGEDVHDLNLELSGSTRWKAKKLYVAQLEYVNKRVNQLIETIGQKDSNAVIVIQSDHGTLSSAKTGNPLSDKTPEVLKERSRNFSAIYLPASCKQTGLYPAMTNVNTFRIVFNNCFGAAYEQLPDKVFYTNGLNIHGEITDRVRDNE